MDDAILARKVDQVRTHVDRVREFVPEDLEAYLADGKSQDLVSFNLILAVQSLVDLATLLISDRGWGVPETLAQVFETLAEKGTLDRELATRLGNAVRMRNILVHRYGSVAHARVHAVATGAIGDLLVACDAILEELGRGD